MYSPREAECQWKFLAMFKGKKRSSSTDLLPRKTSSARRGSMWILSEAETQPASMRSRKPREWILNSVNSLEVTEE